MRCSASRAFADATKELPTDTIDKQGRFAKKLNRDAKGVSDVKRISSCAFLCRNVLGTFVPGHCGIVCGRRKAIRIADSVGSVNQALADADSATHAPILVAIAHLAHACREEREVDRGAIATKEGKGAGMILRNKKPGKAGHRTLPGEGGCPRGVYSLGDSTINARALLGAVHKNDGWHSEYADC
jgi:hypothetical protein